MAYKTSQVAVSTAAQVLSFPSSQHGIMALRADADLYLGVDGNVSASTGFLLKAGDVLLLSAAWFAFLNDGQPTHPLWAYAASATKLYIWEFLG